MRCLSFGLFFSLLILCRCKTIRPIPAELNILQTNCQEPIALQAYLKPASSCTADGFYLNSEDARKRDLAPWIPCNDVEWIDDTQDLFGPGAGNDADTLELSTYHRILRDWLGAADRFDAGDAERFLRNPGQPLATQLDNPILDTAMARAVKELIQGAQHNIVLDVFLLGGSWGMDILHDLAAAADRGVDVVLLHDHDLTGALAHETVPLWQAALQFSQRHPRFVALATPIRPSGMASPAADELKKLSDGIRGGLESKETGRRDHSKVLIIDSLFPKAPEDYLNLKPRAFITSRDFTDSSASFSHDEGVIVRGPAAVIVLLHYEADLLQAWDLAKKTQRLNNDDESLLQSFAGRMETLRRTPTLIQGQGWVSVQPLQVSADDDVLNLDTSIVPRLMAAEHSIDIHGSKVFNWSLAMALKEALARGVKVRVIMDQQSVASARANALLPYMMVEAPRRLMDGRETKQLLDDSGQVIQEADLPIKWFLPFRPVKTFGRKDRSDLAQTLHATTVIIDGRLALFGSANLDALTWAAGSREYAIWVDDPALASESARLFDRLWNHPLLTISHRVWMGQAEPSPEVTGYLTARREAANCDRKAESCRFETILQGGVNGVMAGPERERLKNILAADADRLHLLIPAKVLQDDRGRPQCRKL